MSGGSERPDIVALLRAAGCVFAEDEACLLAEAASGEADLERMVSVRCTGVPLEHVLGWVEFCGERIAVDPGVFVPRPRTELLGELAVEAARSGAVVVELCCGAGAVARLVARRVAGVRVLACDIDDTAVVCAAHNLEGLGEALRGDLFTALPAELRGRVDLVVANPPYVPTADLELLPREAREHEALRALDGGLDGLDLHRRIAAQALQWVAPGGVVMLEASRRQAPAVEACFAGAGYHVRTRHRMEISATVVVASMDPSRVR